ncbi:MAG: cofactor-independent phosphoglycerate mutase [Candidatus Latescibacteria bacterium]|nr:cofactor-independent phosphoglycerate mutase [Candidatus Latescibacterota bacterium]
MNCVVLVGDGMADYPRGDLDGKTVLEAAVTPNMDWIAAHGRGGLARTIPDSMHPGSDVANMEILGYDSTERLTGRAVFEALSMGHNLSVDDAAFRANLVTLDNGVMKDYSAGHITTQESGELMLLLDEKLGTDDIRFYPGVSYRNLMIWAGGTVDMTTTPPHDIIGREYGLYLPEGDGAGVINDLMSRSAAVLADALVNKKRIASGKPPATSVWLWGQGRSLRIQTIEEKFGLKGGVISAVDLVKGIGVAAGLTPVFVPGATGYVDTNYLGKAEAALATLETKDFVYVHVEAPDEASHAGDLDMKIKAIEDFDRDVVGTVLSAVRERDDCAVLVTPDHRTPLLKRTHTREPVPFAYYAPGIEPDGMRVFSERGAEWGMHKTVIGHNLMNIFIGEFIPL